VSALKIILLKISKKNRLTIIVIDEMRNIFHFTYINFYIHIFLPPIYTFSNNKMYMDIYMSGMNTYTITKKSSSKIKMSMEEIEIKLPELCADSPLAKYHIYATINDLGEEEKIEIDTTISKLMLEQNIIHRQYLDKCSITANYDASGELIEKDMSGNDVSGNEIEEMAMVKPVNNIILCEKYVKAQRKW
jgi:hypothetical protein